MHPIRRSIVPIPVLVLRKVRRHPLRSLARRHLHSRRFRRSTHSRGEMDCRKPVRRWYRQFRSASPPPTSTLRVGPSAIWMSSKKRDFCRRNAVPPNRRSQRSDLSGDRHRRHRARQDRSRRDRQRLGRRFRGRRHGPPLIVPPRSAAESEAWLSGRYLPGRRRHRRCRHSPAHAGHQHDTSLNRPPIARPRHCRTRPAHFLFRP